MLINDSEIKGTGLETMGYKGFNYKTLPLVSNIALQYEHWPRMKGLGVGLVNTPPTLSQEQSPGLNPKQQNTHQALPQH